MDRIVAATQMRDFVLIFTERGLIYRAVWNELTRSLEFRLENKIELRDH